MRKKTSLLITFAGILSVGLVSAAPFGEQSDIDYANDLWKTLDESQLVGENSTIGRVYKGAAPHGAILDTLQSTVTVNGDSGAVLVKKNFRGENVTVDQVSDDPDKYIESVTVMFKREGFDPESKDWFWAKYTPAGELMKNPKDMALAGMVAKGAPVGCIACHKAAPGEDFVFIHNRFQ